MPYDRFLVLVESAAKRLDAGLWRTGAKRWSLQIGRRPPIVAALVPDVQCYLSTMRLRWIPPPARGHHVWPGAARPPHDISVLGFSSVDLVTGQDRSSPCSKKFGRAAAERTGTISCIRSHGGTWGFQDLGKRRAPRNMEIVGAFLLHQARHMKEIVEGLRGRPCCPPTHWPVTGMKIRSYVRGPRPLRLWAYDLAAPAYGQAHAYVDHRGRNGQAVKVGLAAYRCSTVARWRPLAGNICVDDLISGCITVNRALTVSIGFEQVRLGRTASTNPNLCLSADPGLKTAYITPLFGQWSNSSRMDTGHGRPAAELLLNK